VKKANHSFERDADFTGASPPPLNLGVRSLVIEPSRDENGLLRVSLFWRCLSGMGVLSELLYILSSGRQTCLQCPVFDYF
jgi:hypothetical protein